MKLSNYLQIKLQFNRWFTTKGEREMFKYYIQVFEEDKRQPQVATTPSDTLLLATSRSQTTPPHSYQHFHMLQEDYQALFYRKLNAIIELQQLEQLFSQNERLFGNLSNTFMQQLAFKSGSSSRRRADSETQTHNAVLQLAKEMISYHSRMRRQCQLVHKKTQLEVEIDKLIIDKRSLIEQIRIFAEKMGQVSRQNFKDSNCKTMQKLLIQQCKKYNISKVITSFIAELKEAIVSNWIGQSVCLLLRKNSEDFRGATKLDELKLPFGSQKNKKQLVSNLTLYLKEFYSSTVYKELTELIANLIKIYQLSKGEEHLFTQKLMESIQNNLVLLQRVGRLCTEKNGELMDFKIDIQILSEEAKLVEKRIIIAEESMIQYIQEETAELISEYQQQSRCSADKLQEVNSTNNYEYFYTTLANKYRQFITGHLKLAEQIYTLKQTIENYSATISCYEEQLNCVHASRSELSTHRTVIFQESHNTQTLSFQKHEKNVGENVEPIFEQKQLLQATEKQKNPGRNNIDNEFSDSQRLLNHNPSQHQSNLLPSSQNEENEQLQHVFINNDQLRFQQTLQIASQKCDQAINNSPSKLKCSSLTNINQMALRMTTLLKHFQRKEKFIVKKSFSIGVKNLQVGDAQKYLDYKEYEIKITKKFLILQPITDQMLSICQKIELTLIRNYHPNYQHASLKVDYSGCSLHLHFLTFNMDLFIKKLETALKTTNFHKKAGHQAKENNYTFPKNNRELVK